MSRRTRRDEDEGSESYFVSLTDLMSGVLFLFIIMLTYFGLELRKTADAVSQHRIPVAAKAAAPPKPAAPVQPPAPPQDLRTALLQRLKLLLLQAHNPADVDIAAGVVRLPNAVLFANGSDQLSPAGQAALNGLAGALMQVLPCAATAAPGAPAPDYCPSAPGRLAAVTLEGHAAVGADSLTRSAVQAAATYRALTAARPELAGLHSDPHGAGPPLISVSGYAAGAATAATTSNAVEIRLYTTP